MKINPILLKEELALILLGGFVLFSAGYFLPEGVALQGATFVAGLIGFVIYTRISNWAFKDLSFKTWHLFGVTLLMSLWASLCLLLACNMFSKLPICLENQRGAFVILNFFLPVLLVFFGWIASYLPWSR